jgi:hypothetical protein
MRKPRPATYNPVQALHLIANDRNGSPLSCPSCSGQIERTPDDFPPQPRSQVTLQCRECGGARPPGRGGRGPRTPVSALP